jgi:hypothetical protein
MDLAVDVADVYGQLLKCLMRFDELHRAESFLRSCPQLF